MDFTLTPEWEDLRTQSEILLEMRFFIWKKTVRIMMNMKILHYLFEEKRAAAKAAGLWAPQAQKTEVGLACLSAHGQPFMKRPIDQFWTVIMNCAHLTMVTSICCPRLELMLKRTGFTAGY